MYLYLTYNIGLIVSSILCENIFCKFKTTRRIKNVLYYFWCFVLFCTSAFRYGIGTDYYTYLNEYSSGVETHGSNLLCLFIQFLAKVHLPFQLAIMLATFLFLVPIMYMNYKLNYDYKFLGLSVLLGFSFYVYSFNLFRQFAALGIMLLLLYKWMLTKQKKYMLLLILPVCIHPSILVAAVLMFLCYKVKFKYKTLRIISIIGIVIFMVFPQSYTNLIVENMMSLFVNTRYSGYVTTADISFLRRIYSQSMEFLPKVLLIPALVALPEMYIAIRIKRRENMHNFESSLLELQEFWVKICFFYFVAMSLKFGSEIVTRFLMFFSIVEIFVIPFAFKYISNKGFNKYFKWVFALLVFALSIYYQWIWLTSNGCAAYPYFSIF